MIKIMKVGEVANDEIFARVTPTMNVEAIVADILADVKANGDAALYRYCEKFDKVKLDALAVSEAEIEEAFASVPAEFLDILREAAANIRCFHEKQKRNSFM